MTPPELTADAPVFDVVHPVVVGVDPLFGHKTHAATVHSSDGFGGNAAAGLPAHRLARLVHGHKPLVREHGLDDLPGAATARHHQFVLLGLDQQAQRGEVGHDLFAGHKTVQPTVGDRGVVVDGRVKC